MTEVQTPPLLSLYDIIEIELIEAQNTGFEPPLRLMFADANDVALMIRFDTIGDGAVSPRIIAAPPGGFGRLKLMAPARILIVDNRERVLSTVIEADGVTRSSILSPPESRAIEQPRFLVTQLHTMRDKSRDN